MAVKSATDDGLNPFALRLSVLEAECFLVGVSSGKKMTLVVKVCALGCTAVVCVCTFVFMCVYVYTVSYINLSVYAVFARVIMITHAHMEVLMSTSEELVLNI